LIAFTVIPLLIDVVLSYHSPRISRSELSSTRWADFTVPPRLIVFAVGSVLVWILVAHHLLSEPNSGPLRFVIYGAALVLFTVAPIVVDLVLFESRASQRSIGDASSHRWHTVISSLLMVSIGVGGLSSGDWYHFYFVQSGATFNLRTPEYVALSRVSSNVTNHELVLTNQCVDPSTFKDVSGARVAFYSNGLAWPSQVNAINKILHPKPLSVFTQKELKNAGIGWLVTSNTCKDDWKKQFELPPTRVAQRRFGSSSQFVATLWRL
jgi:hypothetical protein